MSGVVFFYVLFVVSEIGTGVWLRFWSDHAEQRTELAYWLGGYTAISMVKGI